MLGAYNPTEFRAALSRLAADVTPEEFSPTLLELAIIPRYCALCVQLRVRLFGLDHVTKEILLWEDLRVKLESGDPTIEFLHRQAGEQPEALLARLAEGAGWPEPDRISEMPADSLRVLFKDFADARADLIAQRIVIAGGVRTVEVNPCHLVLGWAVVLREIAIQREEADLDNRVHALGRLLEPAAANDAKVRALYTALQLTFLQPPSDASSSRARPYRFAGPLGESSQCDR